MALTSTLKASTPVACSLLERATPQKRWGVSRSGLSSRELFLQRPWKANSRTVCLFGRSRGRRRGIEPEMHIPEDVYIEQSEEAYYKQPEASYKQPEVVSVVGQPIQRPLDPKGPPAAAFLAALIFAGFAFAVFKAFQSWRKGKVRQQLDVSRSQKTLREEEANLMQARAKLARAFGTVEYEGEVTRPQVASMMTSAANYLFALANEIADLRGEIDDREERLAAAVRKSQQDADERKELIRRISMAEAELVEEQLKQAADKSAAAQREKEIEDNANAKVEKLVAQLQQELQGLEMQMQMKEREAENATEEIQKLHEEVQKLKQGLKEKEGKLTEATRKANEDMELRETLSAQLETAKAELQAATSREDDLKASLAETASGFEGAEEQLEQMQRRHEGEIRAVRGVAQAQSKGLEDRLKVAQEKAAEVQAEMEAETAARKEAEERVEELQEQVNQLEQDLIFLEAKYKEASDKANAPPKETKETTDIAKLKEELESKTQQALAAKDLVLQFMENEREKDFDLKRLRREATFAKERLSELEGQLEVSVASQIEGALSGPKGFSKGGPKAGEESARERARYEQQLEEYKVDSEREISDLRSSLKSTCEQLARTQKQHSMEIETKLSKQERDFRMRLIEKENERDGCLMKVGSLEEELALEVQAREQAKQELSTAQEQLLDWERRTIQMEAAHAAALETEREASRQKLEALYLDYEKAREEALQKESEKTALLQQTEQLQSALSEAKSTRKLQAAKVTEAEAAVALNQDIVEEARVKQGGFQAELEALANQHAAHVKSLEEARASEAASAREEQERLEEEIAVLKKEAHAMEVTLIKARTDNQQTHAQFQELETAHAAATKRLKEMEKQLAAQTQDASLQTELQTRIRELEDLARSKDDVIEGEKARLAELERAKDDVIEALKTEKDDVITAGEARLAELERAKDDIIDALKTEKDDVIKGEKARLAKLERAKDDIIEALKTDKALAALETLEMFEESAVLKERIQELLKEQEGALERFREEAAEGAQELTRVRQRLAEVEGELASSQEELQRTKWEEERLSNELAATNEVTDHQEAYREQIEGLERALSASNTEAKRAADVETELKRNLQEESEKREAALKELQEREETIGFLQRYFEERSSLDVQLLELGRAHSRLCAAKERSDDANGAELSSLESEFSALLRTFEDAVTSVAASYGQPNGLRLSGVSQKGAKRRALTASGSTNGSLAPRALDLVGVDEVASSSLSDLNGRLVSAEQKAEQLQAELRQRVVRQMEWQEDKPENPAENEVENAQGKLSDQQAEIKERVSQMMKNLAPKGPSNGK